MFEKFDLVINSFFGYGIVLLSENEATTVYFSDGERRILNTHLNKEKNIDKYNMIKKSYDDYQRIITSKKRLEEEQKQAKKEKEIEKRKREEERKTKSIEEIRIQKEQYEQQKKYFIYNEKLSKLNEQMNDDIYHISTLKNYLLKNNIPTSKDIIEYCLYYLNYRFRTKEIILRNQWKSIEEYFEYEVIEYDRYFYNNKYELDIYDSIIKRLEKKMILFEAAPGVFVTKRLMVKQGINTKTLNKFHENIIELGKKYQFFSIKQTIENFKEDKIISFASEESQIEKFILSTPGIKSLQTDNKRYLFTFTNERFTRIYFINEIIKAFDSMDIYDLKEIILEDYDVEFSLESIIYCASNSELYYSEEMEKMYKNKEQFLKEVFYE